MDEQQKLDLIKFLKENLTIEVVSREYYTGGNPLYSKCHEIKLFIAGELISEDYID